MTLSALTLAAAIGVGVWSAVGLIVSLLIGRAINDADHADHADHADDAESDADLLADQPADVLVGDALRKRFNKILISNGMKGVR